MIFNLFSKRQKRLRGEVPDIYSYDIIPEKLRVQIVHIMRDAIGIPSYDSNSASSKSYRFIHDSLCREYGVFSLSDNINENPGEKIVGFLLRTVETDKVLDVIEMSFKYIDRIIRKDDSYAHISDLKMTPDDAIIELNDRLKEHGIGYSFDGSEMLRVDSEYMHTEVAKTTIALLWNQKFLGANDEYLKAHEHYRHGRNKECINDCLKALESTMKIICTEKGWHFSPNDPAKKLVQVCFTNGLVPSFAQNQFTSLQSLIESGVPTIRNKLGGHGQGQTPKHVNDSMARYALNLAGANIIFLIEQSGLK